MVQEAFLRIGPAELLSRAEPYANRLRNFLMRLSANIHVAFVQVLHLFSLLIAVIGLVTGSLGDSQDIFKLRRLLRNDERYPRIPPRIITALSALSVGAYFMLFKNIAPILVLTNLNYVRAWLKTDSVATKLARIKLPLVARQILGLASHVLTRFLSRRVNQFGFTFAAAIVLPYVSTFVPALPWVIYGAQLGIGALVVKCIDLAVSRSNNNKELLVNLYVEALAHPGLYTSDLRHIDLANGNLQNHHFKRLKDASLEFGANVGTVRALNISHNNLTELDLCGLKGLHTMNASHNQIKKFAMSPDHFAPININLDNNQLVFIDIPEHVITATLTGLSLRNNPLTTATIFALNSLRNNNVELNLPQPPQFPEVDPQNVEELDKILSTLLKEHVNIMAPLVLRDSLPAQVPTDWRRKTLLLSESLKSATGSSLPADIVMAVMGFVGVGDFDHDTQQQETSLTYQRLIVYLRGISADLAYDAKQWFENSDHSKSTTFLACYNNAVKQAVATDLRGIDELKGRRLDNVQNVLRHG